MDGFIREDKGCQTVRDLCVNATARRFGTKPLALFGSARAHGGAATTHCIDCLPVAMEHMGHMGHIFALAGGGDSLGIHGTHPT